MLEAYLYGIFSCSQMLWVNVISMYPSKLHKTQGIKRKRDTLCRCHHRAQNALKEWFLLFIYMLKNTTLLHKKENWIINCRAWNLSFITWLRGQTSITFFYISILCSFSRETMFKFKKLFQVKKKSGSVWYFFTFHEIACLNEMHPKKHFHYFKNGQMYKVLLLLQRFCDSHSEEGNDTMKKMGE